MDPDNFSNISWNSEQMNAGASSSAASHDPDSSEPRPQQEHEPELAEVGPGLDGELLDCTVSEPHKEGDGTKDAYVSYLITTNSTFPSFQKPVTKVRRRFTDFVFLYKQLCKDFPACAVPPLPNKERMEYVRGDRFGPDFTQRRAHSLQRFLTRSTLHPILRRAPILHIFLESHDWNATMRSRMSRSNTTTSSDGGASISGSGVFDNFADTLMNAFTKPQKTERRFVEVKDKSDKLDDDVGQVEKVVARVVRREADLETDLKDLAEQFQKLITLEPGVEAAVHRFAASVEDTATGVRKLKDHTDQDYLGSLRDMAAYSGALKNLLRAREQKQLDYEQLTFYLKRNIEDRDKLAGVGGGSGSGSAAGGGYLGAGVAGGAISGAGGYLRSKLEDVRGVDHEQSRRDRLRKLELRIDELTREAEVARKTSEAFDDEVVKEVADFARIKRVEFKRQLGGLAAAHAEFYQGAIDTWERYVADMEKDGVLLPP